MAQDTGAHRASGKVEKVVVVIEERNGVEVDRFVVRGPKR